MKRLTTVVLPMLLAACTQPAEPEATAADTVAIDYPASATVDHVDNYHGTEVADPYRWLEDDVRESENVSNWVNAQNAVTFDYLATIEERSLIEKRLTALWDYERFGLPRKEGGRYFYSYNNGLQNQSVVRHRWTRRPNY